eukprot:12273284-Alexandrium_andersonii.AAC.1
MVNDFAKASDIDGTESPDDCNQASVQALRVGSPLPRHEAASRSQRCSASRFPARIRPKAVLESTACSLAA